MSDSDSDSIERQLLAARLEKGVELPDVHRATGVSVPVLAGLESGSFDVVEPVFTRLALGAYAEYLGLDKQAILRQYDARCGAVSPRPQVAAAAASAARASGADVALDMSALRVVAIAAGALVALLLAIALIGGDDDADGDAVAASQGLRPAVPAQVRPRPPLPAAPSGQKAQAEPARSQALPRVEEVPAAAADAGVQVEGKAETPEPVAEEVIAPVAEEAVALVERAPVAEEALVVEAPPAMGEEVEAAVEAVPLPETGEGAVPTAAEELDVAIGDGQEPVGVADGLRAVDGGTLVLEIEAIDSTWVQVKWDESGVFDAVVPPGSVHRWQARDAFIVHSGRAHGVRYTFQGELLGKGALGEATKVLRFRADASGVVLLGRDFQPLSSNAQP